MKKNILLSVVLLSIFAHLGAMEAPINNGTEHATVENSWQGVQEIAPGLFAGKVDNKCYLGMEQISQDQDRLFAWHQYATTQKTRDPQNAGFDHFLSVVDDYHNKVISANNELWILFATNKPIIQRIGFPGDIDSVEMFCTVVTSPDAFVTSHMGIARTCESLARPNIKRSLPMSIYLHSFGAKVMKMRDPKKAFMLTAPVMLMLSIVSKYMDPNAMFVAYNSNNPLDIVSTGITTRYPEHTFDTNPYGFITTHQWLSTPSYQPVFQDPDKPGKERPYMLLDLNALAAATRLEVY